MLIKKPILKLYMIVFNLFNIVGMTRGLRREYSGKEMCVVNKKEHEGYLR